MPDDASSLVHQTLLGDAIEHAAVAVAVLSEDGRYLACNAAFCALTGYTRDEVTDLIVGVGEGLACKDGSVRDVNVWAIPATAAGLPYYVALYWDAASGPQLADF